MDMVDQYDVWLVGLDPTIGSEIQKTRPCLIISPDEMNHNINTVIIAPLTSTVKDYPTRVSVVLDGKKGQIVLDQIRTVDKVRLIKKIGFVDSRTSVNVRDALFDMFDS